MSNPLTCSHVLLISYSSCPPTRSILFPYTTLFRSLADDAAFSAESGKDRGGAEVARPARGRAGNACRLRSRTCLTKSPRSEEHTSELQSHSDIVCRLLLEKKKYTYKYYNE